MISGKRARDLSVYQRMRVTNTRQQLEASKRIRLGTLLVATSSANASQQCQSSVIDVGIALVASGMQMRSAVVDVPRPLLVRAHIRIHTFSHAQCVLLFRCSVENTLLNFLRSCLTGYCSSYRFEPADIAKLIHLFRIPMWLKASNGTVWHQEEAFLLVLRRLSFPGRWTDLEGVWGRDYTQLSRCFSALLGYIDRRLGHNVTNKLGFWAPHFERFNDAIRRVVRVDGGVSICGFIDGKLMGICRPSPVSVNGAAQEIDLQREVFSGHKRLHGVKFQCVQAPNGMFIDYYGIVSGRRHDAHMLHKSDLNARMAAVQIGAARQYVVYGDSAYGGHHSHIQRCHVGARLTHEQIRANQRMSSARICVEWGFAKLVSTFKYLEFKRAHQLLSQPLGRIIRVAVLLANCHTCFYGSETTSYFGLLPPRIEEYLTVI